MYCDLAAGHRGDELGEPGRRPRRGLGAWTLRLRHGGHERGERRGGRRRRDDRRRGGRRGDARRLAPARGPFDDAHVRVEAVQEEEQGETSHQDQTLGALERLREASAH